jgi:hypothetical protein
VPDKTPEQLEKGKEIPKSQKKLTEIEEAEDGQDEDIPIPAKKKRGRPKKE